MAKGNIAKEQVTKTIIGAFGDSFIGVVDKKIYVESVENGEIVQVAISLTCPKTPISKDEVSVTTEVSNGKILTPVDISQEDKEKIKQLKEMLGVI